MVAHILDLIVLKIATFWGGNFPRIGLSLKRGPHNSTSAGFVKDASPSVGPPCACLLHQMWPEVPPPPTDSGPFFSLPALLSAPTIRGVSRGEELSRAHPPQRARPLLSTAARLPRSRPLPHPVGRTVGQPVSDRPGPFPTFRFCVAPASEVQQWGVISVQTVLGAGQGLVRAAVMNVGRSPLSVAGEALDSGNYDVTGECFCHCRTHGLRLPVPTPSLPDLPPAPTLAPLFLNRSSRMGSLDSGPSVKRPSQLAR